MSICQIFFLNMYYIMPYVPVQVVSIGMNIRLQPFAVLCIEVDVQPYKHIHSFTKPAE